MRTIFNCKAFTIKYDLVYIIVNTVFVLNNILLIFHFGFFIQYHNLMLILLMSGFQIFLELLFGVVKLIYLFLIHYYSMRNYFILLPQPIDYLFLVTSLIMDVIVKKHS